MGLNCSKWMQVLQSLRGIHSRITRPNLANSPKPIHSFMTRKSLGLAKFSFQEPQGMRKKWFRMKQSFGYQALLLASPKIRGWEEALHLKGCTAISRSACTARRCGCKLKHRYSIVLRRAAKESAKTFLFLCTYIYREMKAPILFLSVRISHCK